MARLEILLGDIDVDLRPKIVVFDKTTSSSRKSATSSTTRVESTHSKGFELLGSRREIETPPFALLKALERP